MTLVRKFSLVPLIAGLFILSNCKKDELPAPDVEINDTISSEIAVDKGSIGLLIDTRQIAKRGYTPERVDIAFDGEYEKFSKVLNINPNTYIATLKYYVDSLTGEELNGFQNGVPVSITVYDDEGEIMSQNDISKQELDATMEPQIMETSLPAKLPLLKLNSESLFIIQSEFSGKTLQAEFIDFGLYPVYSRDYNSGGDGHQEFYFRKVQDGDDSSYHIIGFGGSALTGRTVLELQSGIIGDELTDEEVYIIRQDNDGWVKIRQKYGSWIKEDTTRLFGNFIEGSETDHTRFRLLNADILWTVTDLGTDYDQPILPQAKLEFAYKATLRNCSGAILTEKIGRSETRTQSYTSGTEESLQLFTSHAASVDISAGVDVEASFFGNGAVYSFEVSAGYTYTTSSTSTTTEFWESTQTNEVEISREREVEIGPNLAVEAYDAVQTISNVKLPFTKKFRVKAKDSEGTVFNGDEIIFQLYANRFEGVITYVGTDYVEFTIKGTTSIDQMMEVDTRVTEIEGGCN
jgi:hypothetical protein